MDKLRKVLSGRDDTPEDERGNIITQVVDENSLSWGTRVKGFAICFCTGFVFSILGSVFLFLPKGLTLFAIFYTLGNVLAISSTCFLMGPINQLKKMFAYTRITATVIMIIAFILTLVAAFVIKKNFLALVLVVIQFCAMTWYSLSYIPYAREGMKKCCMSCIDV
ncbi:Vesicle transport protein SFT2A [Armadillidium nasatum]|uniref:Vesicle transport protein n=1 Tax=Armadillidium nasatum TaxID=96803 RepID=A0A5N5TKA4_9CRUS|nr:Vesicle transport protein SFT2A [Armadillidium nasatum]